MKLLPVLAVMSALVVGCSGSSAKPRTLPSLTATPVVSSSPAAVPAAATLKTPQGAEAFVRFFFDQMNIAFTTSNPNLVRALSEATCGTCGIYERALADSQKKKLRIEGVPFQVTEVAAAPVEGNSVLVDVFGKVPAKRQVNAHGETVQSVPAQPDFHFSFSLLQERSGWSVSSIRVEQT